jgi:arabinose-5-phosphate isomerase
VDYVQRAREVIDIEMEGLAQVRDSLGDSFTDAVERMLVLLSRGGKIIVTGVGKSLHIGSKIAATLTSTGSPAVVLHPSEAMHGDVGILGSTDVVLALSYSGSTEEVVRLVPMIRRREAYLVAISGVLDSPLVRESDAVIPITVDREACPFNMAPTASTAAMLAVGDALAMTLLEARGFSQEDYAKLHPGGAIGRTLLLRVRDVMRAGDRLATVSSGATVQDAIIAMTGCKSGAVAVLASGGKLIGIFTDGDLRRRLAQSGYVGDFPIDEAMTPNPTTVRDTELAVDILNILRTRKINDLIVLDEGDRVVGHIDIQDLPKLKIL